MEKRERIRKADSHDYLSVHSSGWKPRENGGTSDPGKGKRKSKEVNAPFSNWNFERGRLTGRAHIHKGDFSETATTIRESMGVQGSSTTAQPYQDRWDVGLSEVAWCLSHHVQASVCHGKNPEAEGPWGKGQLACHRTAMGRESLLGGGPCEVPHCRGSLDPQASRAPVSKERPQSFTDSEQATISASMLEQRQAKMQVKPH